MLELGRALAANYLRTLVQDEIKLREEQGYGDLAAFSARAVEADYAELHRIEEELFALPDPDGLEPLDWQIPTLTFLTWNPSESELADKLLGAWQGRIAGCVLGKPAETWEFMSEPLALQAYLRETGQWPIRDYLVGERFGCTPSQKGNIRFAESDDDLRYAWAGVQILEKHAQPTSAQIWGYWTNHWTPSQTFTAEQAAIANTYAFGIPHGGAADESRIATIRRYRNPYVEWIGAAIRADGWAYGYAGNPDRAARVAQADARLTHERNGEYSEVFFAAWIAATFSMGYEAAFEVAFETIPAQSRLAVALLEARELASLPEDEILAAALARWGHYHPVHAINNAAACVAAVFASKGDFERAIALAVSFGWDPDCSGATVGSILGAHLGAAQIPTRWIEPFQDEIRFDYVRNDSYRISEVAARTVALWKRLNEPGKIAG